MDYHFYYHIMADKTVKQVNPFTGVEVWSVPGRGKKPSGDPLRDTVAALPEAIDPEGQCAFCISRLYETAPEKARIVREDATYTVHAQVAPDQYQNTRPLFRRISNLFEILSVDYWRKNYSYRLSAHNNAWKESYLANPVGLRHVTDILQYKLRRQGRSDEEIVAILDKELWSMADSFFGGGHELIVADRHFTTDEGGVPVLFFTGDLSDDEHYQYFRFIIAAMQDIVQNNRYVRALSVFKNWLAPAGATFDHLHTQIVAIDAWGEAMERRIKMVVQDKNVYNTYGPNFAGYNNLVFAENDAAIAFAGIGHRYPTVEIFSKSVHARPSDHSDDEVRGMSDMVRAVHAAIGRNTSVNEEWFHTPMDSIFKIPWHVFIRQRINTPAGFEGGTNIFINPLTPEDLRDQLVPRLYALRSRGAIASSISIAEECIVTPNPLQYYRGS